MNCGYLLVQWVMWFLQLTTTTTYYLLVWYCYLLKEASEPSTLGGVVLLAVTHLPIGRLDDWADLLEHLEDGDGDDGDDDSSLSDLSFSYSTLHCATLRCA